MLGRFLPNGAQFLSESSDGLSTKRRILSTTGFSFYFTRLHTERFPSGTAPCFFIIRLSENLVISMLSGLVKSPIPEIRVVDFRSKSGFLHRGVSPQIRNSASGFFTSNPEFSIRVFRPKSGILHPGTPTQIRNSLSGFSPEIRKLAVTSIPQNPEKRLKTESGFFDKNVGVNPEFRVFSARPAHDSACFPPLTAAPQRARFFENRRWSVLTF